MPLSAGTIYVDVKPDTTSMTKKGGGLSTAMKTAGAVAAGAFAAKFVSGGIAEAKEAEKVGLAFSDSLSRGTERFDGDALSKTFDDINNAMGVSDEQLQTYATHFNNAIDFTKFGADGQKVLMDMTALVPNIAAQTGKATRMVEKAVLKLGTAPDVAIPMLKDLGVLTKEQEDQAMALVKAGDEQAATQLAIGWATEKTAGAAEAQTTASEKQAIQWAELQEMVGTALLPILNKLIDTGLKLMSFFTSGSGAAKAMIGVILGLAAALAVSKVWTVLSTTATTLWTAATKTASAATKVWTAMQWAWNAAMSANPIGLIIVAVVALIALVVVLWKKNETFRKIVIAAWNAVKKTVIGVWNGIKSAGLAVFNVLKSAVKTYIAVYKAIFTTIWKVTKAVFDKATGIVKSAFAVIKGIFNKGKDVFGSVFDTMHDSAKTIFNAIASLWNNTVGKLSFHAPSWVPGLGGKGFDVPDIPMMAEGGIVTQPTIAMIGEAGPEAVIPLSGGGMTVRIVDSNLGLVMAGTLEKDKRYGESRGRTHR